MLKSASNILNKIYNAYHKDAGKMLIHTGVITWALSSAAQIAGIIMNDKISKEQKMFLIPQEFADACFNVLSFYLITQSLNSFAQKLVTTGKIIPANLKKYLTKKNFADKIGHFDFDISKVKLTGKAKSGYEAFKLGMGVISMNIGSVISCNIVTPFLRNKYASQRQQANIAKLNDPNPAWQNPKTPREMAKATIHHTYMQAFMNRGNLKV